MRKKDMTPEQLRAQYEASQEEVDTIFGKLEDVVEQHNQKEVDEYETAKKDYFELMTNEESFSIMGMDFKIKKWQTVFDLQRKPVDKEDEMENIKYLHSFIIEPKLTLEEFLELPAFIYKYIEQKLLQNFLTGLVSIELDD